MPVITPSTSLFHQLGEHLRRIVSLADDTEDCDAFIMIAADNARPALAEYIKIRDAEWAAADVDT